MAAQTALLILTHQPARLPFLLDLLDDRFAIYVHVDAKADLALAPARLPPHVQVITPRIPVFWGGWSMMRATLALMEAARDHPRQVLISGDSLPVQSLDHLAETLSQPDTEYIDLIEVPDDPSLAGTDPRRAIERHGWVQPWRRHNYVFWDHPLLNPMQAEHAASRYGVPRAQLDWIRGEAQHAVAEILSQIPPRAALFPKFFYGAQWWALTGATIAGLLATLRDPAIEAYFRYMQVPDEHMLQTILGNQPALLGGRHRHGNPMFTDHTRRTHGDDTLDSAGFRAASATALFARKFDPATAPDVAQAIQSGHYDRDILGLTGPKPR